MKRKVIIDRGDEVCKGLQRTKVVLEDLSVQKEAKGVLVIIGRIRVTNLAFGKFVSARVTFNNWASHRDYSATHTDTSEDGSDDTFAFGFTRRDDRPVYIEFALSCVQDGREYWDNNGGKNYCFHLREDPFSDPELEQNSEPEIVTTWQVSEENSPQKEEIIFDTSSYPHFQAHPLTPTKIHSYTSMREVPEKQILPAKAEDTRHVHAYNALALESLLIVEEMPLETQPDEIQATTVSEVECGVDADVSTTKESDTDEIQPISEKDNVVEEEVVEPVNIVKQIDDDKQDEILDKLTKERNNITIDLQIIEEPGTDDLDNSDRGNIQRASAQNGVTDKQEQSVVTSEKQKANANTDDEKSGDTLKQQKEAMRDEKKKKHKKDKENPKEDKQNRKSSSETENYSESSKKEKIEDEAAPKKPKKSFLSRMACCGKAEPD